jgi:serine/threonine protein phosphatase PrpC
MQFDGEDEDLDIDLFQDLVVGISQKKGVKEGDCEDRVIDKFRLPLEYMDSSASCVVLGCLDGHGGSSCVDYIYRQLPVSILSVLRNPAKKRTSLAEDLHQVLRKAFQVTDHNYLHVAKRSKDNSGTTIVLAVFFGPDPSDGSLRVLLGSLGDSRVILYRTKGDMIIPHASAKSHKPDHPSEAKRIVSEGGQVVNMQGTARVVKRLNAHNTIGLAVSRAFGDLIMKEPKPIVSAVPEFVQVEVDLDLDQFLVLGNDGVFDFISDREVGQIIAKSLRDPASLAATAESLVDLAKTRGSTDDCTCMIVDLAWAKRGMVMPTPTTQQENDEDDIFQV